MFNPYLSEEINAHAVHCRPAEKHLMARQIVRLFLSLHRRARLSAFWAALFGGAVGLLELADVEATGAVRERHTVGMQTVAISQIRGSEGRSRDFDAHFRPLHSHARERWIGVALAYQTGAPATPIELIQVGDVYYVRDGHHRVSAARGLGQEYIDAQVTVWQLAPAGCACPVAPSAAHS